MHPKQFGDRAPPGPAVGAYSAPPDPLAGLRGLAHGEGKGNGRGRGRRGNLSQISTLHLGGGIEATVTRNVVSGTWWMLNGSTNGRLMWDLMTGILLLLVTTRQILVPLITHSLLLKVCMELLTERIN